VCNPHFLAAVHRDQVPVCTETSSASIELALTGARRPPP
jgi:hypothetical protein